MLTQKHPFDLYSFGEDKWVWRDYLPKPISDEHLSDRSNWVNSVAFSPQGNTIVSGSNDMTVKIWRRD